MNSEEQNDRLVDSLLWELLGREMPPDLRESILSQVAEEASSAPVPMVARLPQPQLASARPSRAPLVLALAALVTILGVVGALWQSQQAAAAALPTLATFSGKVNQPLGRLARGARLELGPDSKATLIYEDGTLVGITSGSEAQFGNGSLWSSRKFVRVLQGRVSAEVMPQEAGEEMLFQSEYAEAKVLGTSLTFENHDDRACLRVTEGSVRFASVAGGEEVVVDSGHFAEAGNAGLREGLLSELDRVGVVAFTLMNANSDQPLKEESLQDGEVIALSALPTQQLNIRADLQGEGEMSVLFQVQRLDGEETGIPVAATHLQQHPPFFAAGDHWAEGRSEDCRAWTPARGDYKIRAEAFDADGKTVGSPLTLTITFH